MDKSWMGKPRFSSEYLDGLNGFLNFAFSKSSVSGTILCPCVKCGNGRWVTRSEAVDHLVGDGFIKGYTKWIAHGEAFLSSTTTILPQPNVDNAFDIDHNIQELVYDTIGIPDSDIGMGDISDDTGRPNKDVEIFYELLNDAEQPAYPECKTFSKLSLLVHLFHIKCLGKWTNKSFTMLLELLKKLLPEGETLPKTYYDYRKVMAKLGLTYKKIHACPNDCMLYWKEHAKDATCHVCKEPRYKTGGNRQEDEPGSSNKGKKRPRKVLRHFPLKPRLQRLFMSSKTASFMRWHKEGRTKDGYMRHPADSPAWQTFDF